MRIALVCPYDWTAPGGVQVHVRDLSAELRLRGHHVEVLAPASKTVRDTAVHVVGSPIDIPYNGSTAPIDPRPWRAPRVRSALVAAAPDVVHVHEPLAPNTSMWATLVARAPVVATVHTGADRSRLFDLAAPALRLVARRVAARIAVSERAAEVLRARVPGPLSIIPNGIDVAAFADAEPADLGGGRKLLFVGRLHPRKGFGHAVEAFGRLARARPDVRLVVVGAGAEAGVVDVLPEELRHRVTMLGAVGNRELPTIHRACDIFVAPSTRGESFGIVLLEAMAAGLPVVTTRIPGYVEVVQDGGTGLLVDPGDPEGLAGACARLLDDPPLADRLGRAAAARARRYDWSVVASEVEAVYASVLRERPPWDRTVR
jgi:phosphatidylinositol alpha-mannosyltransferase